MVRNRTTEALRWCVGYSSDKNAVPEKFYDSSVPGAVQLDIAKGLNYPDYLFDDNYRQLTWMENCYFVYRTEFDIPELTEQEQVWFVSKGIDYQFEIRLNTNVIHAQEGMFTPIEINLTGRLLPHNTIEVLIFPAPKAHDEDQDRTQAALSTKPPVSYGWDWHPRLIPSGIWDETGLQIRKACHLKGAQTTYSLDQNLSQASIRLDYTGTDECEGCTLLWEFLSETGDMVFSVEKPFGEKLEYTLDNPELWWTHDHGKPYLYESRLTLLSQTGSHPIDTTSQRVGFRRVKLVMNEGTWSEPPGFPKSRSAAPIQVELNGRRIFVKGTNWVCPDIFPGKVCDENYSELIDIAVESNFNMLRAWGGCSVSKDFFFEYCDRTGILVWQEFPLACNLYPDDKHYLNILRQEAESLVIRLRQHPCLALWCGGNELFNAWSGMTDQALPLRLLNSVCFELSPDIPFIATSPLNGMGHGHYLFYWEGEDVFQRMNSAHMTAYTEFGVPGISPKEVLEKIIPAKDLFPPRAGTAWETHHAIGAWDGSKDTWLSGYAIEKYFHKPESLNDLIELSSLLQGEGYKAVFEEARRQKPYCSMALNWMYCEPWPSAANNSLIVYPNIKKPALEEVRKACRPVCSSLRFERFDWREGQTFECELWMLNDTHKPSEPMEVIVTIEAGGHSQTILTWTSPAGGENMNIQGPTARVRLPRWTVDRFTVKAEVKNHPEMNSDYCLAYKRKTERTGVITAMNMDLES